MRNIAERTKHNDECHLDGFDFSFGNQPTWRSPSWIIFKKRIRFTCVLARQCSSQDSICGKINIQHFLIISFQERLHLNNELHSKFIFFTPKKIVTFHYITSAFFPRAKVKRGMQIEFHKLDGTYLWMVFYPAGS